GGYDPGCQALGGPLKDHLQFDWGAEWEACYSIHEAAGFFVFTEDVLQQLRSAVRDFRMIAEISRSGDRYPKSDNPCHSVERSQMLPGDSEAIERRKVSRVASRLHIELCPDAADEFRRAAFRRTHPGQKKQIARLHRF